MRRLSIFVVSTPLQLLNAIEARGALTMPDEPAELWVLAKRPEHHFTWLCVERMEALPFTKVQLLELDNVSARLGIVGGLSALLRNRGRIERQRANYPVCTRLFIGNPRTREHLYLASLFTEARLTCLDDGTGTVSFFDRVRVRGGKLGAGLNVAGGVLPRLKELCFRLFYGRYRQPLRRADFFTAFVEQAQEAGFSASRNDYAWLASRLQDKGDAQGAHFLGAPFVERNELSWETYKAWLQGALNLLPGPVVYVAHWAESDAQLQRIETELGMLCMRFERPYELEYLVGEQAPACVASWFSSALDVLALVPGGHTRLLAIKVPTTDFLKTDIVQSATAFYERHSSAASRVEVVPWR